MLLGDGYLRVYCEISPRQGWRGLIIKSLNAESFNLELWVFIFLMPDESLRSSYILDFFHIFSIAFRALFALS